jgi:BirA family biotin operon repressor/biotin-[acetyl-CoA-carboxylase] ligase
MPGEPINEAAARQVVERHGFDWHYRHNTESTNADVLHYQQQYQREVVAVSESQSAGRGRRGRQWLSPYARNIYCTIGITKEIPASRQGLLSIVTGLALCRALEQTAVAMVGLKWPNDLLFEGRKLGGILIESRPLDETCFYFAIGFGLNVFMTATELAEIPQPATSLAQIAVAEVDRTQVLTASIDMVIRSIREFDHNAVQELIAEFALFDVFHDRQIDVIAGDSRIRGINRGITPAGQLQLETEQGMELHSAAEISLRAITE